VENKNQAGTKFKLLNLIVYQFAFMLNQYFIYLQSDIIIIVIKITT